MQTIINKNLLKYAASTAIFCPRCKTVMDTRKTAILSLRMHGSERDYTMCVACLDAVKLAMNDYALAAGGTLEVLDAREYFPAPKLALAKVKRALADLGVTITYKRAVEEYRVNLVGGTEATAYYTSDINDALGTGRAMAAHVAKEGK